MPGISSQAGLASIRAGSLTGRRTADVVAALCPSTDHDGVKVSATRIIEAAGSRLRYECCVYCAEGRAAQLLSDGYTVTITLLVQSLGSGLVGGDLLVDADRLDEVPQAVLTIEVLLDPHSQVRVRRLAHAHLARLVREVCVREEGRDLRRGVNKDTADAGAVVDAKPSGVAALDGLLNDSSPEHHNRGVAVDREVVDGEVAVAGQGRFGHVESSSLVDGRELDTPVTVGNTVEDASDTTSLGAGGDAAAGLLTEAGAAPDQGLHITVGEICSADLPDRMARPLAGQMHEVER